MSCTPRTPLPTDEIVTVGWDGASNPMLRFRDELHLPDHARSIVSPGALADADARGPLPDGLVELPLRHVRAALKSYQYNLKHDWGRDDAIAGIRDLTAVLGGIPHGAYVYVPNDLIERLEATAPSDRWSGLAGHARLRVVDATRTDGRLSVVRPDSFRSTGKMEHVPAETAIWCL